MFLIMICVKSDTVHLKYNYAFVFVVGIRGVIAATTRATRMRARAQAARDLPASVLSLFPGRPRAATSLAAARTLRARTAGIQTGLEAQVRVAEVVCQPCPRFTRATNLKTPKTRPHPPHSNPTLSPPPRSLLLHRPHALQAPSVQMVEATAFWIACRES